jgi:hypothetical protein
VTLGSKSRRTHDHTLLSHLRLSNLLELELEFFLLPTVSRPVSLGIEPPFETLDQILACSSFCLTITLFCFQCVLSDEKTGQGQVPVFISPRKRVAQLYHQALGSILLPLTTRRATSSQSHIMADNGALLGPATNFSCFNSTDIASLRTQQKTPSPFRYGWRRVLGTLQKWF